MKSGKDGLVDSEENPAPWLLHTIALPKRTSAMFLHIIPD